MPSAMPMAAMKRMKNTAPPNDTAAVAAYHQVVGHLREDLSQLRQYDGQRQPQVGLVLVFVFRETVHSVFRIRVQR